MGLGEKSASHSRNVRDTMEINKRTRWSRPEDDEKATSGIP